MTRPGISVILCTHNGAAKLPATLDYLARQNVNGRFEWEIVFVDNNSTDRSVEVAQETWQQYNIQVPLLVYKENTPGKYYAFQLAIMKASYDFFIICDDDTGFQEDYLARAFNLLTTHPEIGAAGGRSLLKLPEGTTAPGWLPEDYEPFALGKQADQTGYVPLKKGRLWGAGLASRKDLYRKLYADLPSLLIELPDKKALISEDTEFCARVILSGGKLYYDENLVLHHMLDSSKLTTAHRDELQRIHDVSALVLDLYRTVIKVESQNNKWLYKMKVFFITPFRLLFSRNTKSKARYRGFLQYLYPGMYGRDNVMEGIRALAKKQPIFAISSNQC